MDDYKRAAIVLGVLAVVLIWWALLLYAPGAAVAMAIMIVIGIILILLILVPFFVIGKLTSNRP